MGLNLGYTWMSRIVDDCLRKEEVTDYLYEYYIDLLNNDSSAVFIRMQPLWAAFALRRYDAVFKLSDKGYGLLGKWEDDVYEEYDSGHNRRSLVTQTEFLGRQFIPWCVKGIGTDDHFLQILGDMTRINKDILVNCAQILLEDMMNECSRAYECDSGEKTEEKTEEKTVKRTEEKLGLLGDRMVNIRTSCIPLYREMMELSAQELLYAISVTRSKELAHNADEMPFIRDWLRWNHESESAYIFREGVVHCI